MPRLSQLRRIHIDAVINLPSFSIEFVSNALANASSLRELTLSQLHFPGRDDVNLLPVLSSLSALDQLQCLFLGCVLDRPPPLQSAFTEHCARVACRSPSLRVLSLDSFRLTDRHMDAFRDELGSPRSPTAAASHRRGGGRALDRLYFCRCENPRLTERGCRSILDLLASRDASVRFLFFSPDAVRAAWTSGHPSAFYRQARLLCLLNQIKRGLGAAPVKEGKRRQVWLDHLTKCHRDVNASFAILVKNPDLFARPLRQTAATTTDEEATAVEDGEETAEGGDEEATTDGNGSNPDGNGSNPSPSRRNTKRPRTGSCSPAAEETGDVAPD
jgi:hypothetical protein